MPRLAISGVVAVGALIAVSMVTRTASAAGRGPRHDQQIAGVSVNFGSGALFPWATEGGLVVGAGYAVLGAIGAAVLVYGVIGGSPPGLGGEAERRAAKVELRVLRRKRDSVQRQWEQSVSSASTEEQASVTFDELERLYKALDERVQRQEAQISRQQRNVNLMGFPLYVVLGAFFAVALATTPLQAIVVGFGWTTVLDRFGLKRRDREAQEVRGPEVLAVGRKATDLVAENKELKKKLEERAAP